MFSYFFLMAMADSVSGQIGVMADSPPLNPRIAVTAEARTKRNIINNAPVSEHFAYSVFAFSVFAYSVFAFSVFAYSVLA